ncbi:MAG: alkaline phosphatase family protein [Actinomycetota bacterium]
MPSPSSIVSSAPTRSPNAPRTQSNRRILEIVLENHGYDQIIGSSDAPYLNSLASRYGLATNYHAITHPSLPNYLALIGGDTFGITDDCTSCSVSGASLADQLDHAGVTWKAFMEGLPSNCFTGSDNGDYAKKHDPFVYFKPWVDGSSCAQRVVPLSDLDPTNLPSFSFIIPNLCHDMHDCSVSDGDHWLKGFLPSIIGSLQPSDVIVITFDEDDGSQSNRVATIVISPQITSGRQSSKQLSHYSLLRSIEDTFALSPLRGAASATSLFSALGL